MVLDSQNYDQDVATFSPSGKVYQIEYAQQAVNLGSAALAIKGKDHVVFCAIKKNPNDLSEYIEKIYKIDNHLLCTAAGLTADIIFLLGKMRSKCSSKNFTIEQPIGISRLVRSTCEDLHEHTMLYSGRPLGASFLIGGYDADKGAQLFQTCPSTEFYECKAMAVGDRSQTAQTYLEKHHQEFKNCSLEELILHAIEAIRSTVPSTSEFDHKSCSLAVIGKDTPFKTFTEQETSNFINRLPERTVTVAMLED